MAVATQKLTFAEYLSYSDGSDTSYELVNGELVAMGMGTGLHGEVMYFLERNFETEIESNALEWVARKAVIGVQSPRGGRWDTVRIPDVTVIPAAQWQELRDREAVIRLNEPPPLLVVEVVSESTRTVDYRAKRSEYGVLNIPEYWIVDPLVEGGRVTLCTLVDGFYDEAVFVNGDVLRSPTLPHLQLTAAAVLQARMV
jgi:Uma2 family endonuclease